MGTRAYFVKLKKLPKDFKEINGENENEYMGSYFNHEVVDVFLYNYLDTSIFDGYKLTTSCYYERGVCESFGVRTKDAYKIWVNFHNKKHLSFAAHFKYIKEYFFDYYPWLKVVKKLKLKHYIQLLKFVKQVPYIYNCIKLSFTRRKELNDFFKKVRTDEYVLFRMY